jgi:hypothetical protein
MNRIAFAAAFIAGLAVLGSSAPARADGDDVVTLKDGSTLRGTVVKQEPGKFVVVRTADGKESTLSFDSVARVETSAPAAAQPPPGSAAPADASASGEDKDVTERRKNGFFLQRETTFAGAEDKRQKWLKAGGGIFNFEVRGQGYFYMQKLSTSGLTINNYGGGGGAGFRMAFMYLSLPDPKLGGTWTALRIGLGVDAEGGGGGAKTSGSVDGIAVSGGSGFGMFELNVPAYLGGVIGLGSFDGDLWDGIALKLQYQPSWTYTLVSPGGGGSGSFNFAGFEAGIEFLDKNGPLQAWAPRAHGEVFLFLLPPVGALPLFITLGGGATWY